MQGIRTKLLVISDTHAPKSVTIPNVPLDVAIHCGDLTEESKLGEFRESLKLLRAINAPLKLVIAGNHDFTLDTKIFRQKIEQAKRILSIDPGLIEAEYGNFGDAKKLFLEANQDGIVFLDEGVHQFHLANGATLTVYASPFTSSVEADWGFQYKRGETHDFAIPQGVDVVITHSPPEGILDRVDSGHRGGCEHLFAAVARARPRLHCFGHIHEGWGARLVSWRDNGSSEPPSHFNAIDNAKSKTLDTLASLRKAKWDTPEDIMEKEARLQSLRGVGYRATDHCLGSDYPIVPGESTLFVNAAIQSTQEEQPQLPWVIDLELPATDC
ncbi:Metallo-dependent phosphatase-like protein [Naviculisporaceae sp. PSN 640]